MTYNAVGNTELSFDFGDLAAVDFKIGNYVETFVLEVDSISELLHTEFSVFRDGTAERHDQV